MPDRSEGPQAGRAEMTADDRVRQGQRTDAAGTTDSEPARAGKKNVSAEPTPELSEQGGIEPLERDPAKYSDRTRDRELEED